MSRDARLESIRRWLLAVVVLLGVGIVLLADVGYDVTGAVSGLLYAVGGIVGGVVAVVAAAKLLGSLAPASRPPETSDTD